MVDGKQLTPLNSNALKDRSKVLYNGSIFATIVLDDNGSCDGPPVLTFLGIDAKIGSYLEQQIEALIRDEIHILPPEDRLVDNSVEKTCKRAINKFCRSELGKRPTVSLHIIRLD